MIEPETAPGLFSRREKLRRVAACALARLALTRSPGLAVAARRPR